MKINTLLFSAAGAGALMAALAFTKSHSGNTLPPEVNAKSSLVRMQGDAAYRDLNKNGKMDVYEDPKQPIEKRVQDLLKQMTLEEKAGMMFYSPIRVNADGTIEDKPASGLLASLSPVGVNEIDKHHITHFNLFAVPAPDTLAMWYNRIQQYQEKTRLGIPLTIASDPRNQGGAGIFAMSAKTFSMWPDPLGLAAAGDEKLTEKFADISRQEYLATGIRQGLHPQVDLATEPRWPRIAGTFGEDAALSSRMATAYIKGYQGEKLGPNSVAMMTKHFPGGGPQKDGLDPHFNFQKGEVYPGNNFKYHLIPFEAAFKAGTAAIMPYYGVPMGQKDIPEVGFSYNKAIITELLRKKYHYDGVVCTDWGLVTDSKIGPVNFPARAWGVENLNTGERVQRIIDAGVDQFGGENLPDVIVKLVKEGKVSEKRIDESIVRLLRLKFQLGLFDNPFVDEKKAAEIVGSADFMAAGQDAMRRSLTLLKNDAHTLPLAPNKLKIYVKNIDAKLAAQYGTVVTDPKEADIAIIRLQTPNYPIPEAKGNFIAQMFHWGDLDFKGKQLQDILDLEKTVPTVVDVYIDRPAVIPEISANAKALFASFGSSDAALLEVVFGKYKPQGHLPIELPSSMEAVRNQKEDMPYDSKDPLYKFGAGLSY
ncbi:glycoside hydrolase family 3 protein [Mucilaginibacter sp.]|jgi:beta-glucosidase|uniref:glycoside hydrolase family 3 protein n=1 Tax=Mucilaginibacter sp. TaxID=1882438 RepID=UPI002C5EE050|nr:glycoside hydrolase family 3 N-terminal domain-containing protein [Mucilaginibacter sp.]HTI60079.1 glycoside hydrolase family 3 N-terminal domain-containing protein [Mucilaginibacter sp.]